ncbi:MAG: HDOD domain-containing protein [Desulfuromonadales bacterium]|nr:HDOD domain-containing protein [Desulfuromonadales bacterium]
MDNSIPTLQQLVADTSSICSPPLIYQRLNEVIAHPRSSVKDIVNVVSEDQGLTARLLKLANSPLYGLQEIESISRAATLIGTRELRDLALAVSTMESFPGIPKELLDMKKYWQHGIACGIMARNMAIYLRELSTERFFVAGILHDLGQLVVCTLIPKTIKKLLEDCSSQDLTYPLEERNRLGFNHAELGAALLESWKIPPNIVEPVACHHVPLEAKKFQREAAIIHLADIICQSLGYGISGEALITPLEPRAWELLKMPIGAVEEIVKQSEVQIEKTYHIMAV